jgi:2-succinyl-6-hydroxy-2,4-cyclohexadiene-1-carboxylate synthase
VILLGHPRNPPLVFLHGFLGRGEGWSDIAAALQDEYFCILPDLPGHGDNRSLDSHASLDFGSVTAWLAGLLDEMSLSNIHLVGYSLGGRAALHFAVRYPERIRSLVLESANAGITDEAGRARRLAEDSARADSIRSEGISAFVENWYAMPLFGSLKRRPQLLARIKEAAKRNNPEWMAKVIRELSPGAQVPLWNSLSTLSAPVLLIAGAEDEKYVHIIHKMAEAIPLAQKQVVSEAGHNVHAEQPEVYIGLLREFLRHSSKP